MADVGGIINRLAPLIEKAVIKEYELWINSKTEATKLYFNLKEIQKVLEEAERRRLADPRVKTWLENLQDVMYEIDDALDERETLDLQLEILQSDEENASRTWLEKIGAFIESLCLSPIHVFKRRGIALKMKALNEKVDSLGKETGKYALLPIISDSQEVKYEITASYSNPIEIPYQKHAKEELVNELIREGDVPEGTRFISLVGMVGVGKTTIAQLVFNDDEVKSEFQLMSWICVSHISDMVHLTKAILQSLPVSYPEDAELERLLKVMQSSFSNKKFLLVLDHVRIEDESIWNQLQASLRYGDPGSRILVTSRNQYAWQLINPNIIKRVQPLGEKDCLLLFKEIALRGRNEYDKEKLGGIVKKIAKKCEGLPLAAKTLGHYVQSRLSKRLWDDVVEKEVWKLDEVAKALFAPLGITYNELPLSLKHCLLCCAILPKNVMIDVDELTRLWMVQGYIETEERGWDYFEKLVRNSFFHNTNKDALSQDFQNCRLHPILHDFARYLTKTRSKIEELRSFWSDDWPPKLGSLKSVRVLTIFGKIQKVPSEIGDSIHLRYLCLRKTLITRLPETICNLCNLKTLDVQHCEQLSELPEKIHMLRRNLRHLLMYGSGLKRLPQGLEKLTNLVALDEIYVGAEESKPQYLAKLNKLRGCLRINIGNLNEPKDAEKADLGSKIYISELRLTFHGEENTVLMEGPQAPPNRGEENMVGMEAPQVPPNRGEKNTVVMEALQAPPNLQSLVIKGYNGIKFPSWISTSLNKLVALEIEDCNKCLELPPIGELRLLEDLSIGHMKSLKRVGREFLGDPSDKVIFPNLRRLEFKACDSWEKWEDITEDEANALTIMPRLEELILRECFVLEELPDILLRKATSLTLLSIDELCPLSERYSCTSTLPFIRTL